MSITIIDAPCGAGKTSWAIQEMKRDETQAFIYCTPFLDEITRIRAACGRCRFSEPNNFDTTKIEDFNALIASGTDIAVTHSTFVNATPETLDLIKQGEYVLIIDEALEVVTEFNKLPSVESSPRQSINENDVKMLIENGLITIKDDYRVEWIGGRYADSKFSEFEHLARLNRLFFARNKMMVCVFPPEMFSLFSKVYVMTYLFNASILKYYFDLFHIEYSISSVKNENGRYELCGYDPEAERKFRQSCKEKITVCDNRRLNDGYKKNAFTKTWFISAMKDADIVRRLKLDLNNYFSKVAKAKAGKREIMWTCPSEYQDKIKGKGYTCIRQLTSDELDLSEKQIEELKRETSCFVPLNARASNSYIDRWALAYCYNMHMHPMIEGLFEDIANIKVDNDLFAVSCLIQWIFRSRIRDGQNIMLYLPSPRMRTLLQKWFDCEI